MAFVEINAKYRDCLRRQGLESPDQFLQVPSVVISGHPDRNVALVYLEGPDTVRGYLKCEHRVCWKDRLANAWAGFGAGSKARREALLLRALRQAGIPCPEWLAVGEDDEGRAFVLVREVPGAVDLRLFLEEQAAASPRARYRFARKVGQALARMHAAGFDHPDLYAKHVLVDPATQAIYFLDWQRSRHRRQVSERQRWHDLAALHATLADTLVGRRERLACLRAYFQAIGENECDVRRVIPRILRRASGLLQRRHVREQHHKPLGTGTQNLMRLNGEALCVTREFWESCQGELPAWLSAASHGEATACLSDRKWLTVGRVPLPNGGYGILVCRRAFRPLAWLWARLRRRSPVSPELRQAGLLFRLQRHGVPTPRLLGVGQREVGPGRLDSFLLLEPLLDDSSLNEWLNAHAGQAAVLRDGLALVKRLHRAGCHLVPPVRRLAGQEQ
jgi:tRNA A-37 threonylcarbamoyl transferase component Bud32